MRDRFRVWRKSLSYNNDISIFQVLLFLRFPELRLFQFSLRLAPLPADRQCAFVIGVSGFFRI